MISRRVVLSLQARRQLAELFNYIEEDSGAGRAETVVRSIITHCHGFATFPERGTRRNDLSAGLRIVGYRRRATIAFTVEYDAVIIQGIFYGGQDYEAVLRGESE